MNPSNDHAENASPGRRRFLTWLAVGLGAVSALLVAVPVTGFVLAPVFRRRKQAWRPVGDIDRFRMDETVKVEFEDADARPWAGPTGRTGAWLRRVGPTSFVAFSLDCTHLGCPVRWEPSARLFMCPCHGGVYYQDGRVAAGPPPQRLRTYPVRVSNGVVEIRTTPLPIT